MSLVLWVVVGGIVGLIAWILLGDKLGSSPTFNVFWGIIGAGLGIFIGAGPLDFRPAFTSLIEFTWPGLFASLLGAVVLLAIANLLARERHG